MSEQQSKQMTTVNPTVLTQVNAVPDDWAALGATTGYNPRAAEDLRLWILGPSGEGKTTFLNSMPDTLILDFEGGANSSPGAKATRIYVKNYEHLIKIRDKLLAEAKAGVRRYRRVAADTLDRFISMGALQLQKEKNVEDITEYGTMGHGYNLIYNRCWGMIQELEEAGYAWACTGHLRLKQETDPVTKKERTVPRPSIYPGFARSVQGQSDFQFTIYCINRTKQLTKKVEVAGVGKIDRPCGTEEVQTYYLDTLTTAGQEGKSRGVPDMDKRMEIPLVGGWSAFAAKYNAAVEEAKKKYERG